MADRSPSHNSEDVLRKIMAANKRELQDQIRVLELARDADAARIDALEDRVASMEGRKVRA